MARHNTARKAIPTYAPVAPQLVIGTSLAAALNSVPAAAPLAVPGALASPVLVVPPTATATVAVPQAALHPTQLVVGLGKPYNVRAGTASNNVRSWQAIVAYLAANGGQATVGQLAAHLGRLYNHANMAMYCVRRGYLAPVVATNA